MFATLNKLQGMKISRKTRRCRAIVDFCAEQVRPENKIFGKTWILFLLQILFSNSKQTSKSNNSRPNLQFWNYWHFFFEYKLSQVSVKSTV